LGHRRSLILPGRVPLLGTTLYFQGMTLGRASFTKDWVPMTLVP
jgi:hypothetical protein